mmetsp:Transcript_6872/g.28108  ORF Transcript_6872/g.28108 Transcript_6872/m.28108 type:complete len:259 (+) Transcript_6872:736-1512(+)
MHRHRYGGALRQHARGVLVQVRRLPAQGRALPRAGAARAALRHRDCSQPPRAAHPAAAQRVHRLLRARLRARVHLQPRRQAGALQDGLPAPGGGLEVVRAQPGGAGRPEERQPEARRGPPAREHARGRAQRDLWLPHRRGRAHVERAHPRHGLRQGPPGGAQVQRITVPCRQEGALHPHRRLGGTHRRAAVLESSLDERRAEVHATRLRRLQERHHQRGLPCERHAREPAWHQDRRAAVVAVGHSARVGEGPPHQAAA